MAQKYEKESIKPKTLNGHFYKKLFKNCGRKANDTLAEESCSLKKQRLCSGESVVDQSGTIDNIQSGNTDEVAHCRALPYVNKLHDHRNRGLNAVFFDGQDRQVKVVAFVSSLLDDMKKPILIVASPSALSSWEVEFSKWPNSVNVLTYKGDKDTRAAIRGSDFKVLLSSLPAIVEDMKMFKHIKWELLVIDECQRHEFTMHLDKVQMLMADMKLLTVSGKPVNTLRSYQNILSLLECKNVKVYHISTVRDKLSPFIAFDCTFSNPDLHEYWVPVHLSSMQIEQYRSILMSNSEALSSSKRNFPLHDILTRIQKCCDHPFLADPTLRNSSKEASLTGQLDAEINVSGKLQVLDKLLLEIKKHSLRVLVLFHSADNSEKISTGHFLDDLVHQRFGEHSYAYIPGKNNSKSNSAYVKRKRALEMFNNAGSDRFVILCDYRDCRSDIRLSRVDVVILFNSDHNPSNDIKALKRITIDPHPERLKVFRLYSAFTVEEKALILAKQGTPVDSSYISQRVCHQLLGWGATSYLFSSCTDSRPLFLIDDLVHELSSMLRNVNVETDRSIIANANMQNGAFSGSILLFGETKETTSVDDYLIDNKQSVFWNKLVKESQSGLEKSCSRLSWRLQKSTRNSFEGEDATPYKRSKPRSKRRFLNNAARIWGGTNGGQQSQHEPHILETESERIQKELEQMTKSHKEKKSMLLSECEKEISEVRKKYNGLIHDLETILVNETKIREDQQKLVCANKVLAQKQPQPDPLILNRTTLDSKRAHKETSAVKILEIPASALVRRPCLTSGPGRRLAVSGVRFPAPHLRSNPSLFPSLNNRPATVPTLSTTRTIDFSSIFMDLPADGI